MSQSVDALLARAKALARAGRQEDAAAVYRGILARFPANARARDGLAGLPGRGPAEAVRALLRAGKPDQALLRLEPLIAADPESAAQVDAAMRSALERIARVVVPGSYIHKICTHALAGQTYKPPADAPSDE